MILLQMEIKEIGFVRKFVYLCRNIRNRFSYANGRNNRILNSGQKVNSRFQITGEGNKILIEKGTLLLNSLIRINGNNNTVLLKEGSYISGAELWVEDNNCEINIGRKTFIGHHSHLACTENRSKLLIGDNGMISSYVQIRTGDSHSILDNDGNRINYAQSVIIGDHVWIGEGAKVLKGVTLQSDTVVATGSIVTKSYDKKNVLLAGVPAKIIKEDITWLSERI